jgi:hypothetical protein
MTRLGPLLCVVAAVAACVSGPVPYTHSRSDYGAFRARAGPVPEPNYLPFITHRERLPDGDDALVFCRWPDEAFPLRYSVKAPILPEDLEDEFNPRVPQDYVNAVHRAFRRWEEVVGRPVRFVPVDDPDEADLRVHMEATEHVEAEFRVAGMVRAESERCRVVGPGSDRDHVRIEFAVDDFYVFLRDPMGLLTPGQIERVTLHEIGHVLGASGEHSPLRGDLMYAAAHDRRVLEISEHDRNTFHALYRIRPGEVYVRTSEQRAPPSPEARRSPPKLDRLIRDERLGVQVRFPVNWQVIQTERGWVAVDGLSWDYDASIQVIALEGALRDYLAQYGSGYLTRGELVKSDSLELDGRSVVRVVLRSGERTEETAALEWGPDGVLLVISDCANANFDTYRSWFRHVLLSLEPVPRGPDVAGPSAPP